MLKLNSNPRNLNDVESFVQNLVTKYHLNPDTHGNLLISLTEAVTNAIRHGNKSDEQKIVVVQSRKQSNAIAVRVSDQGPGFDYNNLPDPTDPCNIAECGGRGVFIMRQLCDKINYTNNGSTVEMKFNLG